MKAFHLLLKHRMKYGSWLEWSSKALWSGSLPHLIRQTPCCQESHRPFGNLMAWQGCFKIAATPIWYFFWWNNKIFHSPYCGVPARFKININQCWRRKEMKEAFLPQKQPRFPAFSIRAQTSVSLGTRNIKNKKFFKYWEFFRVFKCRPTGMQRL